MPQPIKGDVATDADRSKLLAPDTTGMNFYRADPALADLLRIHLPNALFRQDCARRARSAAALESP